jgi:hypothetical protein
MILRHWQQWWTRGFRRPGRGAGNGARKQGRWPLALEPLEQRLMPVVGLSAPPPAIPPGGNFDGVVHVNAGANSLGTGALLYTGTDILTAAHCVTGGTGKQARPDGVTVQFDMPSGPVVIPVPASDIFIHPSFTGNFLDGYDIAVIHLPVVPPFAAQRYQLYQTPPGFDPNSSPMQELGQEFELVGYGLTGTGTTGAQLDTQGSKRAGANTVESAMSSTLEPGWTGPDLSAWAYDFDATPDATDNPAVSDGEAMNAEGDSGGPNFINGQLAGLTDAGGDGKFASLADPTRIGLVTRVAYFEDWVHSKVQQEAGLKQQMVLDMSQWETAENTVLAHRNGAAIELVVNGQVLYSAPASQVESLTIDGNGRNNHLSITSDLGIPVTVTGVLTETWFDPQGNEASRQVQDALVATYYGLDPAGYPITLPTVGDAHPYNNVLYTYRDNVNALTVDDDTPASALMVTTQSVALANETIGFTGQTSVSVTADGSAPMVSVALGLDGAPNTFQVDGTPAGGLTITPGNNNDQVMVGDPNNGLDRIGTLNVQGGTGTSLALDDEAAHNEAAFIAPQGNGTAVTIFGHSPSFDVTASEVTYTDRWTVTDELLTGAQTPVVQDTMTGTDVAHIQYSNLATLAITGGTPQPLEVLGRLLATGGTGNTFNVSDTASLPVTVQAGNGADVVNVGAADELLQYVGNVTVNGGTGTVLNLDDQANTPGQGAHGSDLWGLDIATSPRYAIADHSVQRTDSVTGTDAQTGKVVYTSDPLTKVTYQQVASLVINGGAGTNTFNLQGTAPSTTGMSILGGSGNNTLVGSAASNTWSLTGLNSGTVNGISFSGFAKLQGGSGADTFTVQPGGGVTGFVDGGDGPDSYAVPFGNLPAPLTISDSGTAGTDSLTAYEAPGTNHVTKTATQILWGDPVQETINYSGIEHLEVNGSAGINDNVIDPGSQDTTIIGGPGINQVTLANTVGNGVVFQDGGGTNAITVVMGNLLGPVTLNGTTGTTQVMVEAPAGSNVLMLSAAQLTGAGETINFNLGATLTALSIDGSAGQNQVVVSGAPPAPLTLTNVFTATGTSVTASAASPLPGQAVTFTASVSAALAGVGTPTGSVDFFDTTTNTDLGSVPLVNGTASLTTTALGVGSHSISALYGGTGNFLSSAGSTALTVIPPASLSGLVFTDFNDDGQVDFGEQGIADVLITLTGTDDLGHSVNLTQPTDADGAYVFLNLRPGTYTLTEAQPADYAQGINSVGTAGGTAANDQFFINLAAGVNGLNYNYGEQPPAGGSVQSGQTAGIGFWNNKKGQALIKALNGGTGHQLGDWLAATLPNFFGAGAGSKNLAGQSNATVAALFQSDFLLKGVKLDAQVLATALSVYVTNATLEATQVAAQYGFTVSGYGLGTATVNVCSAGDAFGVANNSMLTVLDLLKATDAQAVNGVLYNGDSAKRSEANSIFSALNEAGGLN